ncbi:MAG: choice-of-anchor Q domain-containing protein [Dehalococcoidia bacterium]
MTVASPREGHSTDAGGTFEVNSVSDKVDADPGDGVCLTVGGKCTLRAALQETNTLPGHQTVVLDNNYGYAVGIGACCEDESLSQDLDITDDLTIKGSGMAETAIFAAPALVDRLIDVREGTQVVISDLTVKSLDSGGPMPQGEGCGGGIRNLGDLTLARVRVSDNLVRRSGGGVCNYGVLRVSDSVIKDNVAAFAGAGGGIVNYSGGLAVLERTTISNNRADTLGGGGVANYGTMILRDSVLFGNSTGGQASYGGGGILNGPSGSIQISNSTISGNFTDGGRGGGGISNYDGGHVTAVNLTIAFNDSEVLGGGISTDADSTTTIVNTIVAANENFDCRSGLDSVSPSSGGHNLDGDGSCQLSGPSDLVGVDPLLSDLADNGGPTMTHALLAGSPATNAGDDARCPAWDQRGAPRPVGPVCDIGAYEFGAVVPTAGSLPGDVDCDGALTPFDELLLLRHVGSLAAAPCIELGNLDCDGDSDLADARLLLRRLVGISVPECDSG